MSDTIEVAELRKIGSTEDLEKLLQLAEQIQLSQEEFANKIYNYRLSEVLALVGLMFGVGVVFIEFAFTTISFILLISFVIGFLSAVLVTERNVRLMNRQRANDHRILGEITSLLREIVPIFAMNHQWSQLEKEQFRIRLSRFDIN